MKELPSVKFHDRLADAVQAWERRNGLVGKRGTRRALATAMSDAFKKAAPTETAISPWISGASTPGIDNAYMLAVALGVRPAWLLLEDGDMTATAKERAHQVTQEHPETPMQSGRDVERSIRPKRDRGKEAG